MYSQDCFSPSFCMWWPHASLLLVPTSEEQAPLGPSKGLAGYVFPPWHIPVELFLDFSPRVTNASPLGEPGTSNSPRTPWSRLVHCWTLGCHLPESPNSVYLKTIQRPTCSEIKGCNSPMIPKLAYFNCL